MPSGHPAICPTCGKRAAIYAKDRLSIHTYRRCENGHHWRVCDGEWTPHIADAQERQKRNFEARAQRILETYQKHGPMPHSDACAKAAVSDERRKYLKYLQQNQLIHRCGWTKPEGNRTSRFVEIFKAGKGHNVEPPHKGKRRNSYVCPDLSAIVQRALRGGASMVVIDGQKIWQHGSGVNRESAARCGFVESMG